jgi:D-glycero-D-manno-heptose 1,7-bisphosphate phosphatase
MSKKGQKALFLDRDGVINIDHGYVYEIDKFQFTEGLFELLRLFLKEGYQLFIITNQSGIGRGYYSEEDFNKLTIWMLKQLKKEGIEIQVVKHCPHAPEENCHCRKPKTGMIDQITAHYDLDLENSWLIGDKQSDIDLAHNAGVTQTIAIGNRPIKNVNYAFKTTQELQLFLEENKAIIFS